MTARPTATALLAQGARSAGSAAGTAAAILVGVGLLGVALNWLALLLVLPSAGGALSFGASALVFGVAFPVGWLVAAQPFAVGKGLRRLYRSQRDHLASLIAGALEREAGAAADAAPERWLDALDGLRGRLDRLPRPVRPLVRLAVRRAGLEAVEATLRRGSGSVPQRIAEAIVDRLDAELGGSAPAVWLWATVAANLLGLVLACLAF